MRLLHTSDWHLGRSLHRADLSGEQAAFLAGLVETVRSERVDAVLVAGDVYDRALPSLDAVRLYDDAMVELAGTGAAVVVISGNHDSATRLGVGSRLADRAGVHVRTRPQDVAAPVLLRDDHGEVAVYALPYLEPSTALGALPPGAAAPATHAGVLGRAMEAVRADLAQRPGARSVVLAHAWITGGAEAVLSDSERDITVGGVGHAPAALFDGVDYTALGHLHGRQTLRPGLRYSGSPLAYSFSEASHTKGAWLVDLGPDGLSEVAFVPSPTTRAMSVLRGRLADLLTDPALAGRTDDWVSAVLTDDVRPDEPMTRLRDRFPHALVLEWEREGAVADDRSYGARVARRSDLEVAEEFVAHVRAAGDAGRPSADERDLLQAALEATRVQAASA